MGNDQVVMMLALLLFGSVSLCFGHAQLFLRDL